MNKWPLPFILSQLNSEFDPSVRESYYQLLDQYVKFEFDYDISADALSNLYDVSECPKMYAHYNGTCYHAFDEDLDFQLNGSLASRLATSNYDVNGWFLSLIQFCPDKWSEDKHSCQIINGNTLITISRGTDYTSKLVAQQKFRANYSYLAENEYLCENGYCGVICENGCNPYTNCGYTSEGHLINTPNSGSNDSTEIYFDPTARYNPFNDSVLNHRIREWGNKKICDREGYASASDYFLRHSSNADTDSDRARWIMVQHGIRFDQLQHYSIDLSQCPENFNYDETNKMCVSQLKDPEKLNPCYDEFPLEDYNLLYIAACGLTPKIIKQTKADKNKYYVNRSSIKNPPRKLSENAGTVNKVMVYDDSLGPPKDKKHVLDLAALAMGNTDNSEDNPVELSEPSFDYEGMMKSSVLYRETLNSKPDLETLLSSGDHNLISENREILDAYPSEEKIKELITSLHEVCSKCEVSDLLPKQLQKDKKISIIDKFYLFKICKHNYSAPCPLNHKQVDNICISDTYEKYPESCDTQGYLKVYDNAKQKSMMSKNCKVYWPCYRCVKNYSVPCPYGYELNQMNEMCRKVNDTFPGPNMIAFESDAVKPGAESFYNIYFPCATEQKTTTEEKILLVENDLAKREKIEKRNSAQRAAIFSKNLKI